MKKKLRISIEGKAYEVEVEEIGLEAASKPTAPTAQPQTSASQPPTPQPTKEDIKTAAGDGETVAAPIPGKVLSIKAKPGETVKAGQIILILEAMKMENEISATMDGKIKEILVGEGQSVNTGDPLAVIG